MVYFEPVWISNVHHLDTFFEIMDQTPTWRKLLGRYQLPHEFPRMGSMNPLVGSIPVAMFANGRLSVSDHAVSFESTPFRVPGGKVDRLKELRWELLMNDIRSIVAYKYSRTVINYYSLPWVRIITQANMLGGDFLMCVGGLGPSMEKIKQDTKKLYRMLLRQHDPTMSNQQEE